jgi:hypothetical protein
MLALTAGVTSRQGHIAISQISFFIDKVPRGAIAPEAVHDASTRQWCAHSSTTIRWAKALFAI